MWEALFSEAQDLDDRVQVFESANALETVAGNSDQVVEDIGNTTRDIPSARIMGTQIRNEWVQKLRREHQISLSGHGKKYETANGFNVGIAFANELEGIPNRWFLGLPDELLDFAVLLCQSAVGKLYDLILPVRELGDSWDQLSRSRGQIKFNVRKEDDELLLLVPRSTPVVITKYVGNYRLLS